jgi:muramoyltetrapeptide carboxypeptidase
MIPGKLSAGDEIRVIAPSTSFHILTPAIREAALKNLAALGLHITFGSNCEELDAFHSSSVAARAEEIQAAFADANVKGILTAIGGYSSNQVLRSLDYDLIKANPKVLCGFSDITALSTAIHAKTGLVTYSGPHFSTFGMEKGLEYTLEHFKKCLFEAEPFALAPSKEWSDDPWYRDQENRVFIPNEGYLVINTGRAEGKLLGGNLCTLNLLQGTEYMPDLHDSILLLEDDDESLPHTIDRDLQSLIHQPGFAGVRGLVIGRFQHGSEMEQEKLIQIIRSKPELDGIPVIANADFGHTTPQFTFPIGGTGKLQAINAQVEFVVIAH